MKDLVMFILPSKEEIYNEFHKQKFYAIKGFYPKTIKNFKTIYNDPTKLNMLEHFIECLKRNHELIDWKLYIFALARVLGSRFELKHLGSFRTAIKYIEILLNHNMFVKII